MPEDEEELGLPAEAIAHYINNPVDFIEEQVLAGARKEGTVIDLTNDQIEFLNAVATNKRVTVRSGHGIGKTSTFAFLCLWFITTRRNARIIVTGPKYDQLKDTLWAEVNKWLMTSYIKYLIGWGHEKIFNKQYPAIWYGVIRTAKDPHALAGQHEEHMLILVDEASGVGDLIFQPLEGAMTKDDNRLVLAGNPTQIRGYFYDSHTRDKEMWKPLHYNSENSPIVSKEYKERMARKWGRHSDIYRVRVLGEFPRGNPDAFIPLTIVEMAIMRETVWGSYLEMGVDVARKGDDLTVVCVRAGWHMFKLETKEKTSIDETVNFTIAVLNKYRSVTGIKSKVRIKVDDGGVGGGVTDYLNLNKKDNIEVVACNFGSVGNKDYANAASIMWAETKNALENELQLPDDDDLRGELSSRRFEIDKKGRIIIEPKRKFKKDYGQSPDRADAVVLCVTQDSVLTRVWPSYISTSARHRIEFDIKPFVADLQGCQFLVGLHQNKDSSIYGVCAMWNPVNKKLYVFDEIVRPYATADVIAYEIKKKVPRAERVLGSEEMFNDGQASAMQIRKYGLRIRQNTKYDEAGTIMFTREMFLKNRVLVHQRCVETDRQFREWITENQRPIMDDIGCCLALCYLVSYLKAEAHIEEYNAPAPYSKLRQKVRDFWKGGGNEFSKSPRGDEWMR